MRVIIQRVKKAAVIINGTVINKINSGLLILLGIEEADDNGDIEWLTHKIIGLRIFDDYRGVMNLSIAEIDGEILVVSQFTLFASTKKGNRPSYIKAARPETAIPLYNKFVSALSNLIQKEIPTGVFGAMMEVDLVNDGPVTIIIDSKNRE